MEMRGIVTTKEIFTMMHVVVLFAAMMLLMAPLFYSISKLR
jgi:hypothetical protein